MIRTLSGVSAIALLAVSAHSATAQDLMFPKGEGAFTWDSLQTFADATDLSGQQVTVFGPWLGPDQAAVEAVLAYFADATGADVRYTGSDSFEQQVVIDAEAGSSANVAVFPQPGLAADMAKRGFLTPLGQEAADWMAENYAAGQSWVDLGTYAGADGSEAFYGFPYKADVKSLVWYVPENFEDAGYEVPTTMEELKALTDQIVEDGGTPWCIGLGSGGATGWPATDWVEDMMLRTQSPENYDKWVTNELPFNDPKSSARSRNSAISPRTTPMSPAARAPSPPPTSATAPRVSSTARRSATCTIRRPSFRRSSRKARWSARMAMRTSSTCPPMRTRIWASRCWVPGTIFAITKDSPAAEALIKFLQTPIAHEIWMAYPAGLPDAADDREPRHL